MAKTKEKDNNKDLNDDLAETIAKVVNKESDYQVAFRGDELSPTDIKGFVSTGSRLLDLVISNRKNGGIPFSRITEISGGSSSGKSLISAHLITNVQKMGGIGVLIDTETAYDKSFMEAVGVDVNRNYLYVHLDTVEEIFNKIEKIIETVRTSAQKEKPILIVVDSIAAASTLKEMAEGYEPSGYGMEKAKMVSRALRKITSTIARENIALVLVNQLRQKINAMPFGDQYVTTSGQAIAYHASVCIRLTKKDAITIKSGDIKDIVGVNVSAKVTKNRLGPPLKTVDFQIFFDRGIDEFGGWLDFLRDRGIVKGEKSNSLRYVDANGEEHSFGEKTWVEHLHANPELENELYEKTCEEIVMKYKTNGLTTEDFVLVNDETD